MEFGSMGFVGNFYLFHNFVILELYILLLYVIGGINILFNRILPD